MRDTKRFKKMVFTASLLGDQQNRNSVVNKLASLLVVSLGKTLNGMSPSLCGGQLVGLSSLPEECQERCCTATITLSVTTSQFLLRGAP